MGSSPYVIAVVNQKGGVGKTTTAVNLAACLAASERPTLLIDVDPQANASSAYGITNAERQVYDALIDGLPLAHCAFETELETLHVVPAGRDLVGAEIELVSIESREYRLAQSIQALGDAYEIVQRSLTSPRHAWHLYHALEYFRDHETELRQTTEAAGDVA